MDTFFTEEEAKKANWSCRMCEYEPAKQGSAILPKICKHCDWWKKETTRPNNFELMKVFLIPTTRRGDPAPTPWDCQKLRDEKKENE